MIIDLPKIYYGKGSIENLKEILQGYNNVLLITGKGSIKRSGLYADILDITTHTKIDLTEFWGIKPNPTRQQMNDAAFLGKEMKADLIIAAGGGSAIDAAKVIASMIANPSIKDSWDFITGEAELKNTPTDIVSIITMAGTASENNPTTVITNEETNDKKATRTRSPLYAIEDPKYTLTVNAWQTASGVFDAFSHVTEQWFSLKGSFGWTDNYNVAQLRTLLEYGPKAVSNPNDLDARNNVLISTTMALNGFASLEMPDKDWGVHQVAHALAGKYDTTHGATLAMLTPMYWEMHSATSPEFAQRVIKLGKELWNVSTVEETISELKSFIEVLNLPKTFKDFEGMENVSEEEIDELLPFVSDWIRFSKEEVKELLMRLR